MMLSNADKSYLVDKLPDIELSYDKMLHKKVYADLYSIIPKGKKSLIWFTYFNDKNICLILELDNSNNINNMYIIPFCFDRELSYNTILYGTMKNINSTIFFTCENILFYKNKNLKHENYKTKINLMKDLFKNIKNTTYFNNNNLIISLPIIKNNYSHAYNECQFLNYDIYGIQAISLNDVVPIGIIKVENNTVEATFKVMADIKQDIYNLYCLENNQYILNGIAMIPDYKTSVFMNSLFRTIKENKNLDFLEESDDDEEFENTNEDKFVDLKKSFIMKCVYMDKFRKWKPISIANKHSQVSSNKDLYRIQKK
jgi:hypothetical protein